MHMSLSGMFVSRFKSSVALRCHDMLAVRAKLTNECKFAMRETQPVMHTLTPTSSRFFFSRGVAHLLRDLSELISAATSHTLGSMRGGH